MNTHAIVLAAGRGRRMGGPKHLIDIDGVPMLLHVVCALRDSQAVDLRVVLRPDDEAGEACLKAEGVRIATVAAGDEGRSASVRAGVADTPEGGGLLIALADQPFLSVADFDQLIAAADADRIIRACYADSPGTPVLFAPRYRSELLVLAGSEGGRSVIARHPEQVRSVALDPEHGRDLDTQEDLR
jgi:CTP:molybdopterin cytidylyltransferase MocA